MLNKEYQYVIMFDDNMMEMYDDEVTANIKMKYYRDWYLATMSNESEEYKEEYKQRWRVEKFKFMIDVVNRYIKGE